NVRFGSFAADALCLSTGFCPLLLQEPTNAGAAGVSAKRHKPTLRTFRMTSGAPCNRRQRGAQMKNPGREARGVTFCSFDQNGEPVKRQFRPSRTTFTLAPRLQVTVQPAF